MRGNYHYARSSDIQMATCDKTTLDNRPNDTRGDMDEVLDEATGDKKAFKSSRRSGRAVSCCTKPQQEEPLLYNVKMIFRLDL